MPNAKCEEVGDGYAVIQALSAPAASRLVDIPREGRSTRPYVASLTRRVGLEYWTNPILDRYLPFCSRLAA